MNPSWEQIWILLESKYESFLRENMNTYWEQIWIILPYFYSFWTASKTSRSFNFLVFWNISFKNKREVFNTTPDFLYPISWQPNVADLKYFILCMHSVKSNRSTPSSCKDYKIWVDGKRLVKNPYSITISQDVSIQVQSVWYQTQPGLLLNPRL